MVDFKQVLTGSEGVVADIEQTLTDGQVYLLTLSELASSLATAKVTEDLAKRKRIEIEEKIAALVPGPEKGQKTVSLPDGTKITVERGLNYKADLGAILDLTLPNAAPVKSKTVHELDAIGYEWYRDNLPEVFAEIARFVVATPKKVAVSIKVKG